MMKKIYIATHIDFDGAVCAFLIGKFIKSFNENEKIDIEIEYCEFYNIEKVLDGYLEKIERSDAIEGNFLFISDLVDVRIAERAERLNSLSKRGLNLLYVDHRVFDASEAMNKKYDWVYYCNKRDKCAAMQLFVLFIKYFEDRFGINIHKVLAGIDSTALELISENITELNRNTKYNKQIEIFDALSGEECVLTAEMAADFINDVFHLVWAANLVDYKNVSQMAGLKDVIRYWDLACELSKEAKSSVLERIAEVMKSQDRAAIMEPLVKELSKKTNLSQRISESFEGIHFYKVYDKEGKEHIIAACFGEGDILFTVDDFRLDINKVFEEKGVEPFEIDAFVSFSQISTGKAPVFTIRPLKCGNVLDFFKSTQKDGILFGGTAIGIRGVYEKSEYDSFVQLRKDIICDENGNKVGINRRKIEGKIFKKLKEIFNRVEQA